MINQETLIYLSNYITVTEEIQKKIKKHADRYNISTKVCAWYQDWEDFCSDWCDLVGFTRTEARARLHGGIGEFMILPDGLGIIRFFV